MVDLEGRSSCGDAINRVLDGVRGVVHALVDSLCGYGFVLAFYPCSV
jgi:hypothetical protein